MEKNSLFGGKTSTSTQTVSGTIPDFIPIPSNNLDDYKSSTIVDKALTEKLGRDPLLRLKAWEITKDLLKGRTWSIESLTTLYDTIYDKLKNGPKQQSKTERLR